MQRFIPENNFRAFYTVMFICIAAYLLKGVFYYIVTRWGHMFGARVEADMRRDVFSHMQTLSFSYYDVNRTGKLMSRVTTDLNEIAELAHHGPEDVVLAVLLFVKLALSYMDYRKHGQLEWSPIAIIFGGLLFSLAAQQFIWGVVGV